MDTEIRHAKKLILEDEEGQLLFKNVLFIDASGLHNSLRKRRDGYAFFGTIAEYVYLLNIFYYLEKYNHQ
jgi:hypothetical protein